MSDFITNAELRIEVERLCDENERLQDENARLRPCLSDDAENARQIMGENAKLRDFARSAWQVLTHNEPLWVWKDMETDAHELGIEVE